MRLSIVNYGTSVNPEIPRYAKLEDDKLIKLAKQIIEAQAMPKGAVIVSEVMHTDLANFNNRVYVQKGLGDAVKSFYFPHYTPFLMHHENGGGGLLSGGNPNLISVGTNLFSQLYRRKVETPTGVASGYVKVATFIPEVSVVGGQSAIDALQSRQLMALSIGSRVNDEDYRCSICGLSLYDEECDHRTGKEYDGETCYAMVHNPMFREYSAVYNPSDINALVRRMDVMEGEGYVEGEDHHIDKNIGGCMSIYEISNKVHPSVNMEGMDSKDKGKEVTETHEISDEEVNSMAKNNNSPSIPVEVARLMDVYKQAEEELAKANKRIKELEELANILASALREKISPVSETTDNQEDEVGSDSQVENPDTADTGEETTGEDTPSEDPASEDIDNEDHGNSLEESPEVDESGSQEEESAGSEQPEEDTTGDENTASVDNPGEEDTGTEVPESVETGEEDTGDEQESSLTYGEILERRRSLNSIKIGSKNGRDGKDGKSIPRRFRI